MLMGKSNKVCPDCGRKIKQQFTGLHHCKCRMSWKKGSGFLKGILIWSLPWRKMQKENRNRCSGINKIMHNKFGISYPGWCLFLWDSRDEQNALVQE